MQWMEFPTLVTRGIPEFLVLALVVKVAFQRVFTGRSLNLMGIWPVIGFSVTVGLSAVLTGSGGITALLFGRHTLIFYLLFLAALNTDFDQRSSKLLTRFLMFMALIQIPVALLKFSQFGLLEGGFIGTLPLHSGQLSTVMPLFVIAFLLSAYCWQGKPHFLLLVPWFVAFGIMGEKRAIAFFFPLILLVVFGLWIFDRKGRRALLYNAGALRMTLVAGIIGILSFSGLYVAGRSLSSLNPEHMEGGSFDLQFAVQEMYDYTTGVNRVDEWYGDFANTTGEELTTGRASSTIFSFTDLAGGGATLFMLGRGPGLLIESALTGGTLLESYLAVGIRAGTTGLVWMLQQVGMVGVLFFLSLHALLGYRLWRIYSKAPSIASKAIGLGLVSALFVFLLDFSAYSAAWITTGTVQPVWYFLAARYFNTYG